jgi:DNA polymerase-3 subunit gamma/tau
VAVAKAVESGRDARVLTETLVAHLRDLFLSLQAPTLVRLPDSALARVADQAKRYGAAAVVRAMEVLGELLVELRHAPDPRLLLDVALVRLTNTNLDTSGPSLLERIERLERGAPAVPIDDRPSRPSRNEADPSTATPRSSTGAATARAALGAMKATTIAADPPAKVAPPPEKAVAPPPPPPAPSANASAVAMPSLEMLQLAWTESVLPKLERIASAMYRTGRFVSVSDSGAQYALPGTVTRDRCELHRADVEAALSAHFGRPIQLLLVVDGSPVPSGADVSSSALEDAVDPLDLVNAPLTGATTGIDRLTAAFPGAELIEEPKS